MQSFVPYSNCTILRYLFPHRKVVFALIESWPWAREELEIEMAKMVTEDLEAKQRMA